jgi:hypothetical protein
MKANTRHAQGSTRSRRRALPLTATPARPSSITRKSTYKMRTKCIQKCTCEFINCYTSTTYNFDTPKCTHFSQESGGEFRFLGLCRRPFGVSMRFLPPTLRLRPFALNPGPKLNKTERF